MAIAYITKALSWNTMTQKIAAHAGLPEVKAGQLIEANLDLVLGNDTARLLLVK